MEPVMHGKREEWRGVRERRDMEKKRYGPLTNMSYMSGESRGLLLELGIKLEPRKVRGSPIEQSKGSK